MKPIRILVFAPMPPTISGGIEEYAYSVVAEMQKQQQQQQQQNNMDLKIRVVTSRFKDNSKYPSAADGYILIPSSIVCKRPLPISLLAFFKVINAIRESDIIHIHMPYPFLETFAAFFSKLFSKKVIVTYHMDAKIDDDDNDDKDNDNNRRSENIKENNNNKNKKLLYYFVEKMYYWLSARCALVLCDRICTNTKAYAVASPFLKKYMSKVQVIHQGIRKELYDYMDQSYVSEIRPKYLGQNYSYIVTFVGRLVPYKGLPYLIDAIRLLQKSNNRNNNNRNKIFFIIGGNGPQKQYLCNLVKSYNLDNVIFAGYVKDQDLFNLFAASDLVVSPSVSELESTPISLLSALAAGTSVIGTSIGGTAETIPNDGIRSSIIPIKNSKVLAETITSMLGKIKQRKEKLETNDNNEEMENNNQSKNNKNPPTPRFWSDVAKDYIQLVYRLLDNQAIKKDNNDTHPKGKKHLLTRGKIMDL